MIRNLNTYGLFPLVKSQRVARSGDGIALIRQTHKPETFSFPLQTHIQFGVGVSGTLPDILADWNCQRVGVIVDVGSRANAEVRNLIECLRARLPELVIAESQAVEPD